MFMLKSNGGSSTVSNCQFNDFIGHTNAYSLDLNASWSSEAVAAGNGILYENLVFNNWKRTSQTVSLEPRFRLFAQRWYRVRGLRLRISRCGLKRTRMSTISARMRMGVVGVLIRGRIILAILLPRLSLLRRKFSPRTHLLTLVPFFGFVLC
jgi:hypothetical protein